jgi:Ser/Thr protein kinase RdoA (MazF antagonist)
MGHVSESTVFESKGGTMARKYEDERDEFREPVGEILARLEASLRRLSAKQEHPRLIRDLEDVLREIRIEIG